MFQGLFKLPLLAFSSVARADEGGYTVRLAQDFQNDSQPALDLSRDLVAESFGGSALGLLAGFYVHPLLHEAGHYAAAKVLGYPARMHMDFSRRRFKVEVPSDMDPRHFAAIAAAGPLTSGLSGAVSWAAGSALLALSSGNPDAAIAAFALQTFGQFCVLNGIGQALPLHFDFMDVKTDGYQFLQALKKSFEKIIPKINNPPDFTQLFEGQNDNLFIYRGLAAFVAIFKRFIILERL